MPSQKKKRSKTKPQKKPKKIIKDSERTKENTPKKKETLHIGKIAPINIIEQQNIFFNSLCSINPSFKYPEGCNLIGYTEKFKPHSLYLDKAISILEMGLNDYNLDFNSTEPLLTREETLEKFNDYLENLGIRSSVEVVFSETAIAPTAVTHNPKTLISQVTVSLPISYSKDRIQGVMNHEIGTHLLRTLNERKQIWYTKREKFSLRPYIETEEGLASLNTMIEYAMFGNKKPYLWRAALHYFSSYHASVLSFVDLYRILERYIRDPVKRFKEVLRVKRGLIDTSRPGGCYKDQVYLIGAIKILQNRNCINFYKLYSGKIAVEDIFRTDILELCMTDDIKLPVFLSNISSYLSALDVIAFTNGIE